ncbi:Auxin-responsive protein SAUR15 [Bienertia sinuspersici]
MAIRVASVLSNAEQVRTKNQQVVPKGHIQVYVGEQANKMKRYVVPLSWIPYISKSNLTIHYIMLTTLILTQ